MADDDKSFVLVTLDSCRLDSFLRARTPFFGSLGKTSAGTSHGDSTLPGHKALLHGLLPRTSLWPEKRQFFFPSFAEWFLRRGYTTLAAVSLPYVSPLFGFDRGTGDAKVFCEFAWHHADWSPQEVCVRPLVENLSWLREQLDAWPGPYFVFLNVGETHFPYRHKGLAPRRWESCATELVHEYNEGTWKPDALLFEEMRSAQVEMVEWVDGQFGGFAWPESRWLVTADHGELFGEHERFGHGVGCLREEVLVPVVCSDVDFLLERASA